MVVQMSNLAHKTCVDELDSGVYVRIAFRVGFISIHSACSALARLNDTCTSALFPRSIQLQVQVDVAAGHIRPRSWVAQKQVTEVFVLVVDRWKVLRTPACG